MNSHVGLVSVTGKLNDGGGLLALPGLGMKPESCPPASLTHGFEKEDCVTVWFMSMKMNLTMSPTAAWMVSGVYTTPAPPPTMI